MCRHITREQQIEGWRAVGALLPDLGRSVVGAVATALPARVRRILEKASGRRRDGAPMAEALDETLVSET